MAPPRGRGPPSCPCHQRGITAAPKRPRPYLIACLHVQRGTFVTVAGNHTAETGLPGWADRIRTSRRRFVEQPSTAGEWTHNISGLHANSAGISVRWTKRHVEVRILSPQPSSPRLREQKVRRLAQGTSARLPDRF